MKSRRGSGRIGDSNISAVGGWFNIPPDSSPVSPHTIVIITMPRPLNLRPRAPQSTTSYDLIHHTGRPHNPPSHLASLLPIPPFTNGDATTNPSSLPSSVPPKINSTTITTTSASSGQPPDTPSNPLHPTNDAYPGNRTSTTRHTSLTRPTEHPSPRLRSSGRRPNRPPPVSIHPEHRSQ